jgi:hypothetical protein
MDIHKRPHHCEAAPRDGGPPHSSSEAAPRGCGPSPPPTPREESFPGARGGETPRGVAGPELTGGREAPSPPFSTGGRDEFPPRGAVLRTGANQGRTEEAGHDQRGDLPGSDGNRSKTSTRLDCGDDGEHPDGGTGSGTDRSKGRIIVTAFLLLLYTLC